MNKEILFATENQHKAQEVMQALEKNDFPIRVITKADLDDSPEVIEDGLTFVANAQKKAHQLSKFSHLVTLADDSGLMVDKLNGAPGVHSARYAGEAHNDAKNNAKLLAALGGVPLAQRQATFHTTFVLSWPGQFDQDLIVTGEIKGLILPFPRGKQLFGYDPLFYVPEKQQTFAQMSLSEKNAISHRGIALKRLLATIQPWWEQRVAQETIMKAKGSLKQR